MFSVIIPLYNKELYIEKAINSVLRQTWENFELIIVNDGSTDHSIDRICQLADRRLKIIHQQNSGVSVARNNGVKHATFDYVAFLDADDWWHEHFLEEMQKLIVSYPEAGLYGSSYFVVKNKLNKPAIIGLALGYKSGYIDYFAVYARTFWVPINCSFVIVKKDAFERIGGFKPNLKFGEDLDLWIRIALAYKVGYLNKALAYSNQDVELANRALGLDRNWEKTEHVIFNLEYLSIEEQRNPVLKELLDGLRVRSLIGFYLNNRLSSEVNAILNSVNLANQPKLFRFIYQWPRFLVDIYFWIKKNGSFIKQSLLRWYTTYLIGKPNVE